MATPVDALFGEGEDLTNVLAGHEQQLQTQDFVAGLLGSQGRDGKGSRVRRLGPGHTGAPTMGPVTAEQKLRGRRGEEEIRRRLLPAGWKGLAFVADHRDPPRGYDFLASLGTETVKIEVAESLRVVQPSTIRPYRTVLALPGILHGSRAMQKQAWSLRSAVLSGLA